MSPQSSGLNTSQARGQHEGGSNEAIVLSIFLQLRETKDFEPDVGRHSLTSVCSYLLVKVHVIFISLPFRNNLKFAVFSTDVAALVELSRRNKCIRYGSTEGFIKSK
jgi:hypothetical protein